MLMSDDNVWSEKALNRQIWNPIEREKELAKLFFMLNTRFLI